MEPQDDQYKFYKYVDDTSILVITAKGSIKRLQCPFQVIEKATDSVFMVSGIINGANSGFYYTINGFNYIYTAYSISG